MVAENIRTGRQQHLSYDGKSRIYKLAAAHPPNAFVAFSPPCPSRPPVPHDSRSEPLTVQSLPFVSGGPEVVPTKVAHHNALEGVLPATALAHAAALPHNDLVGAMTGADILTVTRACFRAGAGETDQERIQGLVNEGFFAIRCGMLVDVMYPYCRSMIRVLG